MGQAFDRNGNVLGEAFGETKREVFDKLNQAFKDAHEIRIRSLSERLTIEQQGGASAEMPRYKCHKEVWALKIAAIDGSGIITPADEGYAPFAVGQQYLQKHNPQVGGYYVVYKDGYKSFSPADAFEDGYTRL